MKPQHRSRVFSDEQLDAGIRVLRESGRLFADSSVDRLVVAKVVQAVLASSGVLADPLSGNQSPCSEVTNG